MQYDINELLKLPDEEKIAIADLLYSSVNDSDFDEDEEFVSELSRRVKDWQEGKTKGYTLEEVKNLMEEFKAKYKRNSAASDHWNDEDFVAELEKRSNEYKTGKVKGIEWEESKSRILNSGKK